jgi:hypothetical protein
MTISRRNVLASLLAGPAGLRVAAQSEGWISLFDGKSLQGWKASENSGSWKVVDGQLAADGPRSHLFYDGPVRNGDFRNFELSLEFMTRPLANSGVYFHTKYQEKNWPARGFEVQVNATAEGEGGYRERKKGGSLYGVRNVYKTLAPDNKWHTMNIAVRGKQVRIVLNGMLVVDYIEPTPPIVAKDAQDRVLSSGTFALQCHDPGSEAFYRNIRVRPLPDDAQALNAYEPLTDETAREWHRLAAANLPVVDYHVHLKAGWSLEQALANARKVGIMYGLAVNCGITFPVRTDAGVRAYIEGLKNAPVFVAVQGEGREWVTLVSKETLAQLDYAFTDAMTFTDDRGKRMRLWIKEEVGEIEDRQRFMDLYVDKIVGVIRDEPIDIYANPTFLPDVIASGYQELWTQERMSKVIEAAKKYDVAIEINNRYRIPSETFLKMAKQAGVKFSFGTNNSDANVGRMEYCLDMVKACNLRWQDIFFPKLGENRSSRMRG